MDRIARIAYGIVQEIIKHPFSGAESNYAIPLRKRRDYQELEKLVESCEKSMLSKQWKQK